MNKQKKEYYINLGYVSVNADYMEKDKDTLWIYLNGAIVCNIWLEQFKLVYSFRGTEETNNCLFFDILPKEGE